MLTYNYLICFFFFFLILEKDKSQINIFERYSSIYVCNIQFSSLVNYAFRGMQKKKIRTKINFTHILMTINGEKKSSSQNLPHKIIVKTRVKLIVAMKLLILYASYHQKR